MSEIRIIGGTHDACVSCINKCEAREIEKFKSEFTDVEKTEIFKEWR